MPTGAIGIVGPRIGEPALDASTWRIEFEVYWSSRPPPSTLRRPTYMNYLVPREPGIRNRAWFCAMFVAVKIECALPPSAWVVI